MLLRDSNGMTASDLADKAGHTGCMTLLKEAAGMWLIFILTYIRTFVIVNE